MAEATFEGSSGGEGDLGDLVNANRAARMAADLPGGDDFGVRLQPRFNTLEASIDNLAIDVVPVPEPATMAGLAALRLFMVRRRG